MPDARRTNSIDEANALIPQVRAVLLQLAVQQRQLDASHAEMHRQLDADGDPSSARAADRMEAETAEIREGMRTLLVHLTEMGVEVRDLEVGRLLTTALEADGVAVVRLPAERSSLVVSLLDVAGERTMLSDRVSLDPSRMAAAVAGAEWVHCSGYALADDAGGDRLAEALEALPASTTVSAAGGSLPDDPGRSLRVRRRLATAGVDLLVMGREEAAALLDRPLPSLPAAADALALEFPGIIAVVTGAAAGSAGAGPGFAISVPTVDPATPMLDATGAGDAYVAALIVHLAGPGWPPDLPTLRDAMERASPAR